MSEEEILPEIPRPKNITTPEDAAGMRLDTWLSRLPNAPSRNRVQQLLKDGCVKVDGVLPKRSYEIQGGEHVKIEWPPVNDDWPWPQDIPLDILYEDDSIIVLNKQHGLVVHPSAGHPDGTMVNALLHRFPNLPGIGGVKRPGIVHRLDRDTTGVMVVAKSERAMSRIARQLEKRSVQRRYLALVIGDPSWDETRVEAAVGRDPVNRLRRAIDGPGARYAASNFKVLRRSGQFTLLQCQLETGRTHQIRIHLKHIGHPIACDETYDGHLKRCLEKLAPGQNSLRAAFSRFERPFLHAHTLEFFHPESNARSYFQSPPPDDSRDLLRLIFGGIADEICGERCIDIQPPP